MLKIAAQLNVMRPPSALRVPRKPSPLMSSADTEWGTPWDFFEVWNKLFAFDVDVCAQTYNAKCHEFFTPSVDGLRQSWAGRRCWCNPPYARGNNGAAPWILKAKLESLVVGTLVVMLLPARTDTRWFHAHIFNVATVFLVEGRIPFVNRYGDVPKNGATFPSMVCVWPPLEGDLFRRIEWRGRRRGRR